MFKIKWSFEVTDLKLFLHSPSSFQVLYRWMRSRCCVDLILTLKLPSPSAIKIFLKHGLILSVMNALLFVPQHNQCYLDKQDCAGCETGGGGVW